MVNESRYYKNIAIWLEKKGYYIGRFESEVYRTKDLFINKGIKKAQADVVGIKNVGKSYNDDIEIIIIEVKHSKKQISITLKELEQARGYQTYAHLCYLAITENLKLTQEREVDAKNRNLGLIIIPLDFYKKKPNEIKIEDLKVIHNPSKRSPFDEGEMLEFLGTLDILKCTFCGSYFINEWYYEERYPNLPPTEASFKRLDRNKVFDLFPDTIDLGLNTKHKYNKSKFWKHLCLLCIEDLEKLYNLENIRNEIESLKNEIIKLKQK